MATPSHDGAQTGAMGEPESNQSARSARPSTTGKDRDHRSSSDHRARDHDRDRIGPFTIAEEIGRGSFATVYRGYHTMTKHPVAIKAVNRGKLTPKLLENLESEIRLLKGIAHPNVVELVDCLKTSSHIYLVMAFCSAGDLSQYIRHRGQVAALSTATLATPSTSQSALDRYPHPPEGGLNEVIVREFLGQLATALEFLRSSNIIHRDIKPQNLLLQPATETDLAGGHPLGIPILKVADFGFARFLPQASMAETLCGSPLYMAPEILRYEKYDAKADLWSVGAVLYEMAVGKAPFRAQNHVELLRKIERGEDRIKFPDERSSKPTDEEPKGPRPKVSDDIKSLIRLLLKRNPTERMPFTDFFRMAAEVASRSAARSTTPIAAPTAVSIPLTVAESELVQEPTPFKSAEAPHQELLHRPELEQVSLPSPTSPHAPRRPSSSFAPKYVVGDLPARSTAANQDEQTSERLRTAQSSSPRSGGHTPPELIAGSSLDDHSPAQPYTPRSNLAMLAPGKTQDAAHSPANDDSLIGHEYVVVEKRTVEINALADELMASPQRPTLIGRRSSRSFMTRPAGPLSPTVNAPSSLSHGFVAGVPGSTPYPPPQERQSPSPSALQLTSSSPRNRPTISASPRSLGYASSPLALVGNPSGAIAKVLNMASARFFGTSDGTMVRRTSRLTRTPRGSQTLDPEEEKMLVQLEECAQRAAAIFDFADYKLAQFLPPTPLSVSTGFGGQGSSPSYFAQPNPFATTLMRRTSSSSTEQPVIAPSSALSATRVEELAAEAFILYLKAIAFLQRGLDQASMFWAQRTSQQPLSTELNEAVQWFRSRFNECLDKAEFAKGRLSQETLPDSAVAPEILIYDRALEMSRAAAVKELKRENLAECEATYEAALWLLLAVLDDPSQEERCEADKLIFSKFIRSIEERLRSLRKSLLM
ncbi:uncharacterized protein L969DRAFT_79771 [Mixia osmundae IAM 14324]|uniref:non-specific serine/threonine protein kinase n=1 Tax=Mixia osmundae (strain CBS 9802 / IAM 14324 / JCM 22182 / KY 12970) TaxID=764103 RepID=G7E1T5_MIXOS|nr:uncharacterized protein L969DRAFT_79771 [Mixia osmundae IAM 14324]KEI36743.1 hypothetical protein L969DRAFT_79771 [Mixia osmundae IAM 14324]GAA96795.1 hypothetical protein E5Q_03466 [Mixia osmundae IAM 14324]